MNLNVAYIVVGYLHVVVLVVSIVFLYLKNGIGDVMDI